MLGINVRKTQVAAINIESDRSMEVYNENITNKKTKQNYYWFIHYMKYPTQEYNKGMSLASS